MLSIITPAFNEASNLPDLLDRLSAAMESSGMEWEWIVIDDHSSDATLAVVGDLAASHSGRSRIRGFRFSRNFGSHLALACGLDNARGDCAVIIAGDLQDPPEVLPLLLERWRNGAQVVWAVRRKREGENLSKVGSANLFYFVMRHFAGVRELPPTGADFFLLDRVVIDAVKQFTERNVSLMALVTWMGFSQTSVQYDKQARLHGKSGWSLEKKLKLAVDSITSFTYLPIRAMTYLGMLVAISGFVYAGMVVINGLRRHPTPGWSSLMVVVLVLGGAQMLMLGVLGEYLWRAFDESRRRPRYLVERLAGNHILAARAQSTDDT